MEDWSSFKILERCTKTLAFLEWDRIFAIFVAIVLTFCIVITNLIKGIFVYYVKFKAIVRPINRMICHDQVSFKQTPVWPEIFGQKARISDSNCAKSSIIFSNLRHMCARAILCHFIAFLCDNFLKIFKKIL